MRTFFRLLPLMASSAMATGCAAQGEFPSLAPRAVEREFAGADQPVPPCLPDVEETETAPVAPPPPMTVDAALMARIDELTAAAREGDRAFAEAVAAAATAVSGAGEAGSESWIAAQVAVSEAEMARTPTTTALAELTALALEESTQALNPLDQRAIEQATGEVQSLADRQAERLQAVKSSLSDL